MPLGEGENDRELLRLERDLYLGILKLNAETALEPFLGHALDLMLRAAGAALLAKLRLPVVRVVQEAQAFDVLHQAFDVGGNRCRAPVILGKNLDAFVPPASD